MKKQEVKKDATSDTRNWKEKQYDKIPISVKALDVIIGILVAILVIMLIYFVIRRYS